jgi:mono/diheme cytochrome c family protein
VTPAADDSPAMRAPVLLFAVLLLGTALTGCRGMRSERPPIHPNLNMDFSEAFQAQKPNPFFEDGMAMRQPVPGTVARARLLTTENAPLLLGRSADGGFVPTMPMAISEATLARGFERYEIYCSVCHGGAGDGQGIIMTGNAGQGYGYTPAPTFHSDYLRGLPDGYLYSVIANGVRNMPGYGHQIQVADRWAIVAHIRALQRSQAAGPQDLPDVERQRVGAATVTRPTPEEVAPDAPAPETPRATVTPQAPNDTL